MSKMQWRTARVRVNSNGEWKLRVTGTDIYVTLYRDRHPELDPFPGQAMGHRLIELGWMPDRRRMMERPGMSPVEKLAASMYAGWEDVTDEDDKAPVWEIPVYREVE